MVSPQIIIILGGSSGCLIFVWLRFNFFFRTFFLRSTSFVGVDCDRCVVAHEVL